MKESGFEPGSSNSRDGNKGGGGGCVIILHPFCKDLKSFVSVKSYTDILTESLQHKDHWKEKIKYQLIYQKV